MAQGWFGEVLKALAGAYGSGCNYPWSPSVKNGLKRVLHDRYKNNSEMFKDKFVHPTLYLLSRLKVKVNLFYSAWAEIEVQGQCSWMVLISILDLEPKNPGSITNPTPSWIIWNTAILSFNFLIVLARHFNLPNHSQKHMAVCGLSLHLGNTESRKHIEQKFIFQIGTLGINERFSFL